VFTAQFFFRKELLVTASGSATAESNVSEEDAYNIALNIAKEVAQSSAQQDANVIIQSVNTSTLGDNTLFLTSSLLNGYITQVSTNEYNLVKDFFSTKYILNIETDEIFNIKEGVTLTCSFINKGIINNYGNYNTSLFRQNLQKNNKSTTSDNDTSTYDSSYNDSIYDSSYNDTLNILNVGTLYNYTFMILNSDEQLTNLGTITNYGLVSTEGDVENYGEYIQDICGNDTYVTTPMTYNYNIINNYYNTEYDGYWVEEGTVAPGTIYYGTITINGGDFGNTINNTSLGVIYLNYSTQGSEIPSETYFLKINGGNMYCQDPSNVTPPTDYYNVYWNTTTTPMIIVVEDIFGPIYSNSYTTGTSDPAGNPYALAAQQIDPGLLTFYLKPMES
jgi:hypothetical protein